VPPLLAVSPFHAGSPMSLVSPFHVAHSFSTHPREQLPREEVFVYDRTSLNTVERRASEDLVRGLCGVPTKSDDSALQRIRDVG
jgi:hypothetical protein